MLFLEKENQPMNPNLPSLEPQSKRNEQEIPTDNQFKRHKISQFPKKNKSENIKFYCYSNFPKKKKTLRHFYLAYPLSKFFHTFGSPENFIGLL
jgi:hypothetical protein